MTHLMAADALERGFSAMILQARDPWRALELCGQNDLRAILNHRIDATSPVGHYSVFVRLAAEELFLHDPQFGPDRRLSRSELLTLWRSERGSSDVAGCVLVAFANTPAQVKTCPVCKTASPSAIRCPSCQNTIQLHPAAVLGCVAGTCPMRAWEQLFCPQCDKGISDLTGQQTHTVEHLAGETQTMLVAQYSRRYKNEVMAIYSELLQRYAGRALPDLGELVGTMKERLGGVNAKLRAEYQARIGPGVDAQGEPATAPAATGSKGISTEIPAPPAPADSKAIGDEILDQEQIQTVIRRLLQDHRDSSPSSEAARGSKT